MTKKIKWLCRHCRMTGTVDPSQPTLHFCHKLDKYIWIRTKQDALKNLSIPKELGKSPAWEAFKFWKRNRR